MATVALHATGVGAGRWIRERRMLQVGAGAALAAAGAGLLVLV